MPNQRMQLVLWTIVTLATVEDGFAQTTRRVDCSAGQTIAAAVAAAKPGDTLAVRGACKETVIIPAEATSTNRGVAVRCEIGGYVAGPLGTLSGTAGIKAFDQTCVDRVTTR